MVLQVWGCSAGCRDALGTSNKSSARGEVLASTEILQGETYGEKKHFGKRDFIALGLCEENKHFITA